MKKIVTILLFALTVFAGCSKDEKPTPAPTMPVNGVIYLHSESVLKNEPAAKAATRGATAAEQTLTYTFEAWTNDTKPRCVLHKIANGTLDEAAIEIALVPGTCGKCRLPGRPIRPAVGATLSLSPYPVYSGTAATAYRPR